MKLAAAALVACGLSLFGDIASVSAANPCVAAADAAQDLRKDNKLREARASLLVCSNRSCNSVVRTDCEKWLKEVEAETPSLVIRAVDSRGSDVIKGTRVTIDDSSIELDGAPVTLDPGTHVIKAKARSGDIAEQTTLLAQGEKARVVVVRFKTELDQDGNKLDGATTKPPPTSPDQPTTPTEPTKTPPRVIPIALAGIGVVALVVFGYLEVAGHSAYADLENTCGRTPGKCPPSRTDPVKQQFVGAAVALGISAIALGAAAVIYFTGRSSTPRSTMGLRPDGAIVF